MGMRAGVPGGVSSGEAEAKTATKESWWPHNLSPWLMRPRRAQGRQRPRLGPVVRVGVTRLPELRGCWVVDGRQTEGATGSGALNSAPGP